MATVQQQSAQQQQQTQQYPQQRRPSLVLFPSIDPNPARRPPSRNHTSRPAVTIPKTKQGASPHTPTPRHDFHDMITPSTGTRATPIDFQEIPIKIDPQPVPIAAPAPVHIPYADQPQHPSNSVPYHRSGSAASGPIINRGGNSDPHPPRASSLPRQRSKSSATPPPSLRTTSPGPRMRGPSPTGRRGPSPAGRRGRTVSPPRRSNSDSPDFAQQLSAPVERMDVGFPDVNDSAISLGTVEGKGKGVEGRPSLDRSRPGSRPSLDSARPSMERRRPSFDRAEQRPSMDQYVPVHRRRAVSPQVPTQHYGGYTGSYTAPVSASSATNRVDIKGKAPDRNDSAGPGASNANSAVGPMSANVFTTPSSSKPMSAVSPATTAVPTQQNSPERGAEEYTKTPVSAEAPPIRSMFPQYNHTLPTAMQHFRAPPVQQPYAFPMEQGNRLAYPAQLYVERPRSSAMPYVTPVHEVGGLWDVSNGMVTPPSTRPYCFKLHRSAAALHPTSARTRTKEGPGLSFGPNAHLPFYSIAQSSFPAADDPLGSEDQEHELIVFRHHPTRPDILPIAHLSLVPPPPPDASTTKSGSFAINTPYTPYASLFSPASAIDPQGTTQPTGISAHISTIFPILASLQALEMAAASPMAKQLAIDDPCAQSPQAQALAQQVVAQAADQESADLYWSKTGPKTGEYELRHPRLGFFKVVVKGDISRTAFGPSESTLAPMGAQEISISILKPEGAPNPTSAVSPAANPSSLNAAVTPDVPSSQFPAPPEPAHTGGPQPPNHAHSRSIPTLKLDTSSPTLSRPAPPPPMPGPPPLPARENPQDGPDGSTLVRLDLATGMLSLNVDGMKKLHNAYAFDLLSSTAFIVAAAEARRGKDRGLEFMAPPIKPWETDPWSQEDPTSRKRRFKTKKPATNGIAEENHHDRGGPGLEPSRTWPTSRQDLKTYDWKGEVFEMMDGIGGDLGVDIKKDRKGRSKIVKREEGEKEFSWPVRVVLGVLVFAAKVVWWFFKIGWKIVRGVGKVVMKRLDK
ncbi:hypothetical protein P152DRAFT_473329 [Eremomyces bilateralis CBS 781.70]|uniref:Uncharacterized protein n=1 Tax=Eremomyces bilateralis CBS 781.70 TaxID=1392243 RepID=A0A6G1G474_9PEZI|nr:uncharacterized protein P152DRAFT_473329 [Eremomyces bilateralis CBS 781.70]KAF1812782.1 hypothetical protein P152DRAFT_473329 [Eremomyces bilateralis CBS 781.70]